MISLYIPFVISFNVDTSGDLDYFEIFIDLWFFFEIITNFFTGFFDKGRLVFNLKTICMTYLKGWFIIDAFSSSPMIVIRILDSQADSSHQAVKSAKLFKMLRFARYARLIRLMKFSKLSNFLAPLEELIITDSAHLMVRFLKISVLVTFVTHWFACTFYIVGTLEFDSSG